MVTLLEKFLFLLIECYTYKVLGPNRQVELFCTWLILLNMDNYMLYKIPYEVFKIGSAFGVRK